MSNSRQHRFVGCFKNCESYVSLSQFSKSPLAHTSTHIHTEMHTPRPHFSSPLDTIKVRCGRIKRHYKFEDLQPGRPFSFQIRAANNEGLGPWSAPSEPTRTLTKQPAPPPPPCLAFDDPPPGPLSLWLSVFLPDDDGGDAITAMLLEIREHSNARAPEWGRCERHPVPRSHDAAHEDSCSGLTAGASGSYSGRWDGGSGGGGNSTTSGSDSIVLPPTCEIIILVGGLKPRTFYSFRSSAVNGKGAGKPGPPCRRVRTSPPRPPTWTPTDIASVALSSTVSSSSPEPVDVAMGTAVQGGHGGARGAVKTAAQVAGVTLPPPPRAIYSGPGRCTVAWDEPFCNGAPIETYQVESARLGAAVEVIGSVDPEAAGEKEAARSRERKSPINDKDKDKDKDPPPPPMPQQQQRTGRDRRVIPTTPLSRGVLTDASSQRLPSPSAAALDDHTPQSQLWPIVPTASPASPAGAAPGAQPREVIESRVQTVLAHMRVMVVRQIAHSSEYVFRVAGVNAAGQGEWGPWSELVHVPHPDL